MKRRGSNVIPLRRDQAPPDETDEPGALWVVTVELDGSPLAVIGCGDHHQSLIDSVVLGSEKAGRTVGELVDCGRLAELPNAAAVSEALAGALGAVACPACHLSAQQPEQQSRAAD